MDFKEQAAADISAVFLNLGEFGETHVIDGKPVTCVIDEDSDGEFTGDITQGVYVTTKRVYVRASDLTRTPKQGKVILVDGDPYTCLSISHEIEMLMLVVTENCPV